MPDTVSHFLHGYFIYGLKGGLYATLPDLLSFGRLFIKRIPEKIKYFKEGKYNKLFEKPKLIILDDTDKLLYNLFHSLIIWFIIYLFKRDKEFICIFLAIIIDVLFHRKSYLPTPFLYPISDYKLDGIHWNSKKGWILSFIVTYIIYKYSYVFRFMDN